MSCSSGQEVDWRDSRTEGYPSRLGLLDFWTLWELTSSPLRRELSDVGLSCDMLYDHPT